MGTTSSTTITATKLPLEEYTARNFYELKSNFFYIKFPNKSKWTQFQQKFKSQQLYCNFYLTSRPRGGKSFLENFIANFTLSYLQILLETKCILKIESAWAWMNALMNTHDPLEKKKKINCQLFIYSRFNDRITHTLAVRFR